MAEISLDEIVQAQVGLIAIHADDDGPVGTQDPRGFGSDARGNPGHDYPLVGQLHTGFPILACTAGTRAAAAKPCCYCRIS
ncbi:hypothetical protein D3C84_1055430 [compost metagenome]